MTNIPDTTLTYPKHLATKRKTWHEAFIYITKTKLMFFPPVPRLYSPLESKSSGFYLNS